MSAVRGFVLTWYTSCTWTVDIATRMVRLLRMRRDHGRYFLRSEDMLR